MIDLERAALPMAMSIVLTACATSREFTQMDREHVKLMLHEVSNDVRDHYYDLRFHGVDWDAAVVRAEKEIDESTSLNIAMTHVAAVLASLDDSHTFFIPPARPYRHDYGFRVQAIGNRCFITHVRPKSDAEGKGLKPGHELLAINNFQVGTANLDQVEYVLRELQPQAGLRLTLKDLTGEELQLDVLAQTRPVIGSGRDGARQRSDLIREAEDANDLKRAEYGAIGEIEILKLRGFNFDIEALGDVLDDARQRRAMIIDLRGNLGGGEDQLKALIGALFDKDVKLGDLVGRKERSPMVVEAARKPFSGKLVVLVDSLSASSSEVLARVVKLEKRGTVMGDRSAGSVMRAMSYTHQVTMGINSAVFYGASVTVADLIMIDGKTLEHAGVMPDVLMVPTAADLVEESDPVLSHAVETLGGELSPREAEKLFPYRWPRL